MTSPTKVRLFLIIAFLAVCPTIFAQPGGGGDPGPGDPVPLSGVEILLALGAGLGMKKLVNRKGLSKNHNPE